jgi:prepilin-type N-terminal cleavage/methylation domain-containing protein
MISLPKCVTSRRRGFTLIELLVVILIICILMAVLMPVYGMVQKKAKREATQSRISGLTAALEQYRVTFDSYPPSPIAGFEDDGTLYTYLCGKDGRGIISDASTPRQKFFPPMLTFGKECYKFDGDKVIIVDSWGTPMHYFNCKEYVDSGRSGDNCHKPDKVDIWSYGEDKQKDPDLQEPGSQPIDPKTEAVVNDLTNWGAKAKNEK